MSTPEIIESILAARHRSDHSRQLAGASIVERVSSVAHACQRASADDDAALVWSVACVARATLAERERTLRANLEDRVAAYDEVGAVPSLFKVMGLSDRELPYNRALAWVLDPRYAHGAALPSLRALAKLVDFPELQADLDEPSPVVEVRGERPWPPEAESSKEPDLLVLTPNAILLLENKVKSPESGDQYPPYLAALKRLAAARGVSWQAWLAAPNEREVPDGWTNSMDHAALAACLTTAALDPSNTAWGRVACLLVAEEVVRDGGLDDVLGDAREVLSRSGARLSRRVADLAAVLRRLPEPTPPTGA